MGTTATTQHANLIAFSPPFVKGSAVELRLHFADRALDVAADIGLIVSLRDALCALLPPPAAQASKRPGHNLHPARVAIYRRVIAAVEAGASWQAAANVEGVSASNVQVWWSNQKKRAAKRAPGAFLLKPSGAPL